MKWYNNLTIKYLKENKRRTIVTIVGIILSVSLMCGITTIMESYKNMEKNNAIRDKGNIHLTYRNISKDVADKIIKDNRVKDYYISAKFGDIDLGEDKERGRVNQYEKKSFEALPANLTEGRYPENNKEIILSENLFSSLGKEYKIGDEIEITVGSDEVINKDKEDESHIFNEKETRKYKIVGLFQISYWDGSSKPTGITLFEPSQEIENIYLSIYFNDIKDIHNFAEQIAESADMQKDEYGEYNIFYNEDLLRLYGESKYNSLNTGINTIIAIVVILISLITIVTIYNAFSISILERKKQFGVLNSLGATASQIRNVVIREAMAMSIIAIPVGIFIGTVGIQILFNIVVLVLGNTYVKQMGIEMVYSLKSVVLAVILSIITIFISALLPAIKATKISPIEAIKNTGDFKVKRVRKNRLIKAVFGFEGELAYKNLKRNRKKFRITLFSLVVSMIIFLGFSGYINLFKQANDIYRQNDTTDFTVYTNDIAGKVPEKLADEVSEVESIKQMFNLKSLYIDTKIKESDLNSNMPESYKKQLMEITNDLEYFSSNIISVGNKHIKDIKLSDGKFDIEEAKKKKGVILVNKAISRGQGKIEEFSLVNYKVGDKIIFEKEIKDKIYKEEVEVLAIADDVPSWMLNIDSVTLIGVDELVNDIDSKFEGYLGRSSGGLVIESKNIEDTRGRLNELVKEYGENKVTVRDVEQDEKEARGFQMLIQAFIYAFIIIISTISVTNVVNTISTNFRLRKREFAMIQSTGITPGGFKKMIYLESIYYSIFTLLYSIPISIGLTYIMHQELKEIISFKFIYPWEAVLIGTVILLIVSVLSAYMPMKKMEKESIVDNIREENI